MHRAQGKQKKIKQGGHNPLCPYKIINTVDNKVIGNDRRKRGNLNLQIFSYSSLITYYANRAMSRLARKENIIG